MQSNDEREQTLNQILSEMDGFDSSKGVVLLGATNRPEVLDKALLRPGRFDRRVVVDRPEFKGREAILKVHAKNIILGDDVDLAEIARSTAGAVGADLANVINEAALRAVRRKRKVVLQEDLREAVEVIIAGKEKKDAILSEREREIVSYHEVGHALVSAMLKNTKPVHKITIVPRMNGSLGYTMPIEDEEEKFLQTKEQLINEITIFLGGRAAEEEKFNLVTSGASNDIERATQIARSMVSMYGMSDRFDMMGLESIQNRYLDGRAVRNCSEQTSAILDEEALNIIKEAHKHARQILRDNMDLLDRISKVLIEKENIFGDEFLSLIYEKYPEKKEEAEKERIAKEKRLKEVEQRRAKRHGLDSGIKEESKKELNENSSEESKDFIVLPERSDIDDNLESTDENVNTTSHENKEEVKQLDDNNVFESSKSDETSTSDEEKHSNE